MPNPYFQFKQFTVYHDRCAMKVTTDACLFGAWVADEMREDLSNGPDTSVLDIGTGSGLLSLMVAQKNRCIIDAVEIDKDAAQQAMKNVAASPWKKQITVHQGNVLEFSAHCYDIIISNPPFYENEIISSSHKKNTAHHGEGLKLSDLISFISRWLDSSGCFYLLLPYKRQLAIDKAFRKEGLFLHKKIIVSPSIAVQPFRLMIKGGRGQAKEVSEKKIFITDEQKNYTPEFITLLKDYYLYL